jgi:L-ectoine synthase
MYALDKHDRHTLRADEELVMACVFNPPVTGTEVHREGRLLRRCRRRGT